jgi:hypothetical protein
MGHDAYSAIAAAVDKMEMDSTFTISENGVVMRTDDYVPDVVHDESADIVIDSDDWEAVTHGMSGQYGYRGPVMHPSEFVGSGIIERIMYSHDAGTVFGITTVRSDDSDELVGWVILRKRA